MIAQWDAGQFFVSLALAAEVYDRANLNDIRSALGVVSRELLPVGSNLESLD